MLASSHQTLVHVSLLIGTLQDALDKVAIPPLKYQMLGTAEGFTADGGQDHW